MHATRLLPFATAFGVLAPNSGLALDCATREPDHDDPSWTCQSAAALMADHAAQYGGDEGPRCVPASAFASWGCLALDTDARLCEDGPFNMTVSLGESHTSLDCAGQTLMPTGGSSHSGFRTPYTRSVEDIHIANCQVVSSPGYGVDLKRYFRADEPCLHAPSQYELEALPQAGCEDALVGHRNIRIENLGISGASRIGIYVGQGSRDVHLHGVDIDGAYLGIYLEASSAGTWISQAVITNSHTREGIAVDSSRHNVIEHSLFERNGEELYSGINLYKNAGEFEGQVCPVVRPWGADQNLIRDNHFYKDDVNVAARESHDRYILCDQYYYCSWNYRDRANENVFVDNVFHDGAQLDVHDDTFIVHGNRFERGAELELGGKHHVYALQGTVAHNVFEPGASVLLNDSEWENLDVRNNVDDAGDCISISGLNQCGLENTLVWGDLVVSAGLLAVLL